MTALAYAIPVIIITACILIEVMVTARQDPQAPAPAAPDLPIPQPGRAAEHPAGDRASDSAAPAG